jgi:hypothetical protein
VPCNTLVDFLDVLDSALHQVFHKGITLGLLLGIEGVEVLIEGVGDLRTAGIPQEQGL